MKRAPIFHSDIKIEILDYQANMTEGHIEFWINELTQLGATSVEFTHVDDILTFSNEKSLDSKPNE